MYYTKFDLLPVILDCPCLGVKPADIDEDDMPSPPSPKIPIATNNELFPWNNPRLPTFIKPMRYKINIHPNLTTLDVKGGYYPIFKTVNVVKKYNPKDFFCFASRASDY